MTPDYSLKELVHVLAEERNFDLRGYKNTTLERRIRKRMFQVGAPSYGEYLEKVRQDPRELNELLNTVLINVTEFFRDPQAWDSLRSEALPRLLRDVRPGSSVRAWSAGCASGEEAYSLAILLADYFGNRVQDYDIKIYATDIDEDALNVARRGEYPPERVRRIRPDWRSGYFNGDSRLRVSREVRRMVIFGRSNLVSDAPISHCHLVLCRNVLIYFDTETQRQVLNRLHYSIEPGGILFLGKAESKLSESRLFRSLDPRWRIFMRAKDTHDKPRPFEERDEITAAPDSVAAQQELSRLKLLQRHLLETLTSGVLVLDANDVVTTSNDAALGVWGLAGVRVNGRRVQDTELVKRCPELVGQLELSRRNAQQPFSFQCQVTRDGEDCAISIVLRPVLSEEGDRTGTVIYAEDVSAHVKLHKAAEQLEATGEELQSANEELETTNEELQSTNEELETTNEELQSTNEELETTNEELQSLNAELETMNEELESRGRELNALSERYAETLKRMPWPVLLIDDDSKIQIWNAAAQRLFGVGATSVVGVDINQLPVEASLRANIVRRYRAVLARHKSSVIRSQTLRSPGFNGSFDIHFTPIFRSEKDVEGVLCMVGPFPGGGIWPRPAVSAPDGKTSAKPTVKKAKSALAKRKASAGKPSRSRAKRK